MFVKDCIYQHVFVPKLCQNFIDTKEFQRLRRVKQLGVVHYAYPSATHSRFEHCLGVMHLAGVAVDSIVSNTNLEVAERNKDRVRLAGALQVDCLADNAHLEVSARTKDLVMLAGLLHDIGHMAYSHTFDRVVKSVKGLVSDHEDRAEKIIRNMNEGYLTEKEVNMVVNMILGVSEGSSLPWLYQIVNNKLFEVDVDKLDYLQRDAYHTGMASFQSFYILRQFTTNKDGNLALKAKAFHDVEQVFVVRKYMFATVYLHKTVAKIAAIYETMLGACVGRLTPEQVATHFCDDFRAETYLRSEYPRAFALLDRRKIEEAAREVGVTLAPTPEALIPVIHHGMLDTCVGSMTREQVVAQGKGFCSNTYLRSKYPRVFALLDQQRIKEAARELGLSIVTVPAASYTSDSDNLDEIMGKVLFV